MPETNASGGAGVVPMLHAASMLILAVISLILLFAALGVGLFLGLHVLLAIITGGVAIVALWKRHGAAAIILGLVTVTLLFWDPFHLTLMDVRLAMGVTS